MVWLFVLCNIVSGNTIVGSEEFAAKVPYNDPAVVAALDGDDERVFEELGWVGDRHFPPIRVTRIAAA